MPLGNWFAIDDANVTAENKYRLTGKLNSTTSASQFGHDEHRVVTFGNPGVPGTHTTPLDDVIGVGAARIDRKISLNIGGYFNTASTT